MKRFAAKFGPVYLYFIAETFVESKTVQNIYLLELTEHTRTHLSYSLNYEYFSRS